jgi:hypothetical protein
MIAHWYNDAGTWRQTNAFWYKDGSTWREMAEVWYNDGGTWRRVHRRELRKPSTNSYTSGGTGTNSQTNPGQAYDTDDSTHILTYGTWQRSGLPAASRTSTAIFSGFSAAGNTYNTLRLYISAAASGNNGETGATSSVQFDVTTDVTAGTPVWVEMWKFTTPSTITGSLAYTLSTSQDLTKLGVRLQTQGASGGGTLNIPGDATADVYDIFTVGTY